MSELLNKAFEMLPDAIIFAIDNSGMQCAFNTPPIFHNTGRWIPTGAGKRVDLGLADVRMGFNGATSLRWINGLKKGEAAQEAQKAMQDSYNERFPAEDSRAPVVGVTDPRVKGPDAFGGVAEEPMTATDLVQGNLAAMGLGPKVVKPVRVAGPSTFTAPDGAIEEPFTPEVLDTPMEQGAVGKGLTEREASQLEIVTEMTMALIDQLPKTKRAKLQGWVDRMREFRR